MQENKPKIVQHTDYKHIEHYLPDAPWLLKDFPEDNYGSKAGSDVTPLQPVATSCESGVKYCDATLHRRVGPFVPNYDYCKLLWDAYDMPEHIRAHSTQVARITSILGDIFTSQGVVLDMPMLLAGALLHDIAKIYTIRNGGSHAQIGAGIVTRETGNRRIAQIVYHHVYWPWKLDINNDWILPVLIVDYADKRVQHDRVVTLQERYDDLLVRYGKSEKSKSILIESNKQVQEIEKLLSKRVGVDFNEHTFDGGRLVC